MGRASGPGTANARRIPAGADPLDRILGYLDFRKQLDATHAGTSAPCDASIGGHAAMLEADIAEAMRLYGVSAEWSAQSLTFYVQSALQGAVVLAKAKGTPASAAASIDHLGRYIELLFKSR